MQSTGSWSELMINGLFYVRMYSLRQVKLRRLLIIMPLVITVGEHSKVYCHERLSARISEELQFKLHQIFDVCYL